MMRFQYFSKIKFFKLKKISKYTQTSIFTFKISQTIWSRQADDAIELLIGSSFQWRWFQCKICDVLWNLSRSTFEHTHSSLWNFDPGASLHQNFVELFPPKSSLLLEKYVPVWKSMEWTEKFNDWEKINILFWNQLYSIRGSFINFMFHYIRMILHL